MEKEIYNGPILGKSSLCKPNIHKTLNEILQGEVVCLQTNDKNPSDEITSSNAIFFHHKTGLALKYSYIGPAFRNDGAHAKLTLYGANQKEIGKAKKLILAGL